MKPPASDLIVYDMPQGEPSWFDVRRGRITSSEFQKLMADNEAKKGRLTLLRTLAGERISGQTAEAYTNAYMKRGHDVQAEALDWYARTRFADVESVGFVYDPALDAGWSPDGTVGSEGAVEIKSVAPHLLIPILEKDEVPNEHIAQCQGGALWIGRRKWIDLVLYFPGMPKFVKRLEPDINYQSRLAIEVFGFNRDLTALVKKIEAYK